MNRTPVADWQRLSALYEQADTLDHASLDDWLAGLRAEDHPLLAQLEQMLAAREQVQRNGFLGTPPRVSAVPAPPEPMPIEWQAGSRIGPYRVLRKLGSGGMAEVWLAQRDDGAFQRQVAIKLLFRHRGSNAQDTFAQRFDRERDILASLDHPHIAGLHDAGVTPSGQPWLALEYVEGETLIAWADGQHLGTRARVRLFRQVLRAVQHAHANLVIHRDLKPANILVTPRGEVRLLDFGIAKLMEPEGTAAVETELTRIAGRPMTPRYAAPEQLLGQPLTTACDVYSLGVVLYELLCGEQPYELKVESAAQLEQAILDDEPRAPSRRLLAAPVARARGTSAITLRKQLANDLDAITLRALAKATARRYGSVEAFGADLDRWLAGEPVDARSPTTVYRIGKFVRRHAWGVSLGMGAAVSLVVVASAAVVMGLQARDDSARAGAARDFMLNIFARANQEKSRGADITARDLLETGRKDILARLAGQPVLQAELLRGIAKVQYDMGEYATADSTLAELVRIHAAQRLPRDEAMARADRADNALQMNDLPLAERYLTEARLVSERPLHDAALAARFSEVEGRIVLGKGDAKAARQVLAEARELAARRLGADHLRTFRLGQALLRTERDLQDLPGALALQKELRLVASRMPDLNPTEVGAMDWEQVNLLFGAGRFVQALELLEQAVPRCHQVLGPQEQSCRYLFLRREQTLLRLGRLESAAAGSMQVRAMADDATLPFLQVEALLAAFQLSWPRPADPSTTALLERVKSFGESGNEQPMKPTFKANALLTLAEFYLRTGSPERARAWSNKALSVLGGNDRRGAGLRLAAMAHMLDGVALRHQGRTAEALAPLQGAAKGFADVLGSEHAVTQIALLNVALALAELRRSDEALALVRHAQPLLHDAFGTDAPVYRGVLFFGDRLGKTAASGTAGKAVAGGVADTLEGVPANRFFFR